MIVVEERLTEVFSQLPQIGGFTPVYKWGNEDHLNKVVLAFEKGNSSPYPLIYQTSDETDQDPINGDCTTNLTLVIATRNTDTSLLNENRWAMSYRNVLVPLVNNIETALKKSGIVVWNEQFKTKTFPNYGNGDENKTVDIWDAIRISTRITITNGCVNTIRF